MNDIGYRQPFLKAHIDASRFVAANPEPPRNIRVIACDPYIEEEPTLIMKRTSAPIKTTLADLAVSGVSMTRDMVLGCTIGAVFAIVLWELLVWMNG